MENSEEKYSILKRLAELHKRGILTDEEFEEKKKEILQLEEDKSEPIEPPVSPARVKSETDSPKPAITETKTGETHKNGLLGRAFHFILGVIPAAFFVTSSFLLMVLPLLVMLFKVDYSLIFFISQKVGVKDPHTFIVMALVGAVLAIFGIIVGDVVSNLAGPLAPAVQTLIKTLIVVLAYILVGAIAVYIIALILLLLGLILKVKIKQMNMFSANLAAILALLNALYLAFLPGSAIVPQSVLLGLAGLLCLLGILLLVSNFCDLATFKRHGLPAERPQDNRTK